MVKNDNELTRLACEIVCCQRVGGILIEIDQILVGRSLFSRGFVDEIYGNFN